MAKITFIGDSIISYMPYIFKGTIGDDEDEVKYFGVENVGVGTYMNYCWPKVDKENVDVYILLIGINNIYRPDCDYDERESLEDCIEKIKQFINQIIDKKASKLLVQSIYPAKCREKINSIKIVNKRLEIYCAEKDIEYLDLYSLLIDDEELFDRRYSDDRIHPNELGYNVIASEINKKLKKGLSKKLKYSTNLNSN